MAKQITLGEFKQALEKLDCKLLDLPENERSEFPIAIRAIGGFALMYHNVRTSGMTYDIDTVTVDYSPAVENAIKEVSNELDIADDWLNNYNVLENDIKTVETMLLPRWEKNQPDTDAFN